MTAFSHRASDLRRTAGRVGLLGLALGLVLLSAGFAPAAPPENSLRLVPADAGLYMALLRNKQQYDLLVNSRWLARLKQMPAFQEAWDSFQQSWDDPEAEDSPAARLRAFRKDPENRELIDLGLRLTHDEIFLYGDETLADVYDLYQEANWAGSFAMYEALATGDFFGTNPTAITARAWGEVLLENKDRIAVPKLLVGFKIREADIPVADKQLERLTVARELLGIVRPELKERLRKIDIAGSTFWTLELEGSDLEWDSMPLVALADEPEFKPMVEKVKSLRMAVSVGVREGYLLVSMGPSNDHLAELGQGMLLADRPEMSSVRQFADKPLTAIGFLSEKFQSSQTYLNRDDLETLAGRGKRLIQRLPLDFDVKRQMQADVDELAADLVSLCPEFGPAATVAYLTDGGYEVFAHNWTKYPTLKPMGEPVILQHIGEAPLLVVAGPTPFTVAGYEMLTKWLRKGRGYFEQFALAGMTPEQHAEYDAFLERFLPLAVRFDKLTREKFLPAVAGGQMALLLDASLKDEKWSEALPPTEKPLRLVQPALTATVSDGKAVADCLEDYRRLINDVLVQWTTFYPESAPDFLLPDPRQEAVENGKVYSYPLGEQVDVSPRVAPNYGIAEKLLAVSAAPETTNTLLGASKPALGSLAKEIDGKTVTVVHLEPARAVDAIWPWIRVGNQLAANDDEETLENIKIAGELVRSIRSITAVTRLDGEVLVTHERIHLTDLEE